MANDWAYVISGDSPTSLALRPIETEPESEAESEEEPVIEIVAPSSLVVLRMEEVSRPCSGVKVGLSEERSAKEEKPTEEDMFWTLLLICGVGAVRCFEL